MAIGTTALIGGALGLGGSLISANAQDKASKRAIEAAQFNPYNVGLAGGSHVGFDPRTNQVVSNEGAGEALARSRLTRMLMQDDMGLGGAQGAQTMAGGQMGLGMLRALQGLDSGFNQGQGSVQGFIGNQRGLMGLGGDLINGVGNTATQAGVADPIANMAANQGGQLVQGSLQDAETGILQRLRDQAQPSEERAVNSRLQSLFNKGIMSSTSGARALGELGLQQENADISRQNLAEQLAMQKFTTQQNAGQGLLGLGQQGLLEGRSLNQGLGGLFGGLGQNEMARLSGLNTDIFNAGMTGAGLTGNRGTDRLSLLQNVFGFGQNASTNYLNQIAGAANGMLGLNQDQRATVGLGGNIGGQQAAAGAQIGQTIMNNAGSPAGGFLSGVGGQLMQNGGGQSIGDFFGGLFGGGKTTPPPTGTNGSPF